MEIDLEVDAVVSRVPKDATGTAAVAALVDDWDRACAAAKKAEAEAKLANATKTRIEQELMPAAMEQAGLTEFKTTTGRVVKVDNTVRGNIPALSTVEKAKGMDRVTLAARREAAFAVLHKNWPGLIKTEVSVALGAGEAELALRIAETLRERFELSPAVAETVNPQTLNAHFRELLRNGEITEVPAEPFALYIGPIATIK